MQNNRFRINNLSQIDHTSTTHSSLGFSSITISTFHSSNEPSTPTSVQTSVQPSTSTETNQKFYGKNNFCWDNNPTYKTTTPINSNFKVSLHENLNYITTKFGFFDHLISDEIINIIVDSTNVRLKNKTDKIEIRAFLGLLLLFGLTKKRDIEISDIWCPTSAHHLEMASACMSRNRFKELSSSICFDNINTRPERKNDKFDKMREIFDIFQKNNSETLIPSKFLTVDEQLYSYNSYILITLRKNKPHIPLEFLSNKKREVNSSIFAYHEQLTLVSYVPKLNKSVILISSHHHTSDVTIDNNKKPVINVF